MPGSFWRQFAALCKKNYILLWRAKWINLVRCLLMPVAYAAFFSQAQNFFAYIGVVSLIASLSFSWQIVRSS